jgi:hypothetical protein
MRINEGIKFVFMVKGNRRTHLIDYDLEYLIVFQT